MTANGRVPVRAQVLDVGGPMTVYDEDTLYAEVAYIAYHFHWSLDDILDLEHPLRRRFVAEISKLNERANEGL